MKTLILDRDGVINVDSPDYIKTPEEWVALPQSIEAIVLASAAGWRVFVASNQSGLSRGLFDQAMLDRIFAKMFSTIKQEGGYIEACVYCPHAPEEGCECRKPKPGLLFQIRDQYHVDLSSAIMVGDSLRDIEAARQANVRPILVKTGNGEKTLEKHPELKKEIIIYSSLWEAVVALLKNEKN